MKPQNKIQEYIEKRNTEQSANEQEENERNEKIKQKNQERKEAIGKVVNMAGNAVQTGASLIPHVASFALGFSADKLKDIIIDALKGKK